MKTFTPRGADLDELYTATGTTMLTDRWWYQRGHYPLFFYFFRGFFKRWRIPNDPGSALPVSSANCLLSIVPPNGMVITSFFFASAPSFFGVIKTRGRSRAHHASHMANISHHSRAAVLIDLFFFHSNRIKFLRRIDMRASYREKTSLWFQLNTPAE